MKKTRTSLVVLIATCLFSLLFLGCKNKTNNDSETGNGNSQENVTSNKSNVAAVDQTAILSLIPDDAPFVFHIDLKSIWDKGDLDNANQVAFIKYLKSELKEENANASKIVNELIDNPNSCGLNLKGNIFIFTSESMKAEACVAITVNDSEQFKNFLMNLETNANLRMDFSTESRFNTAYCSDLGMGACWDNQKAYFFPVEEDYWSSRDPRNDVRDYADRLMSFGENASMSRNNDFQTFIASKNDIGWFLNMRYLIRMLEKDRSYYEDEAMNYIRHFQNTSYCISLNFEQGFIKLQSTLLGMEGNSAYQFVNDNFNKKLLDYLPQQTFAAATYSYNIENLIKMLDDNGLSEELNETIEHGSYRVRDLLNCFTGNIAVSLSDINIINKTRHSYDYYYDYSYDYNYEEPQPVFTLVGEINNSRPLKQTLDEMDDFYHTGDTYIVKDGDISIKISDNIIMVSNDMSALNAFSRGGDGNGVEKIAAKAGKGNYIYLDLDPNNYPSSVKKAIDEDGRVLSLLEDFLQNAEVKMSNNYSYEIVINLKHNEKNSLKCIIDQIDNNLATIQRLAR